MDTLLRLLLRFILVPLGYLAAVIVGAGVILLGSWRFAEMLVSSNADVFATGVLGFAIAGPVLFVMLFSVLWLPGAVGIVISEAFAIRSWIFHALNGAISAWVGWQMLAPFDGGSEPLNATQFVFGAGLARAALRIGRSRAGARGSGSRCSGARHRPRAQRARAAAARDEHATRVGRGQRQTRPIGKFCTIAQCWPARGARPAD